MGIQELKGADRQPVAVQYGKGTVDGFSENHCKSSISAVLFDIEIHRYYYLSHSNFARQHLTSLKRHLISARETRYAEHNEKTCRSYYL